MVRPTVEDAQHARDAKVFKARGAYDAAVKHAMMIYYAAVKQADSILPAAGEINENGRRNSHKV